MKINVTEKSGAECYSMLVGLIAPRPIAWVTSKSEAGVVNLAPFSFFNLFGVAPPMIAFSPTMRADGSKKDTLLNVESNGQFVVHAATFGDVEQVNASSKVLPHDVSEAEYLHLPLEPSCKVAVPKLANTPWAAECTVYKIVPLGDGPLAGNLIIGEIVYLHVSDEILDERNLPDPRKLNSVARLGGEYWCRASDLFTMQRPR